MERLTKNEDVSKMSMYELAHNSCYIGENYEARYRDYSIDIDARSLTRRLLKDHADGDDAFTCDYDFDEQMIDYLQYEFDTIEGLIAVFYRNLWAMANLRKKLKKYEDAEEQGLLLKLPCKVGDTVYAIRYGEENDYIIVETKIIEIRQNINGIFFEPLISRKAYKPEDFGKEVFLKREEAEHALKKMKSEG